jgi:hypothetical protein
MYTPPLPKQRNRQFLCWLERYDMRFSRVKCEVERCAQMGSLAAREDWAREAREMQGEYGNVPAGAIGEF